MSKSKSKDKARSLIPCPNCFEGVSSVSSTRWNEELQMIRRRRRCLTCGHRFSTYETSEKAVTKTEHYQKAFDRIKKAILEANSAFLRLSEYLETNKADEENTVKASREIRNSIARLGQNAPSFSKREQRRRDRLGIRDGGSDTGTTPGG